ncbi:MAG: DNA repair protein RecN [Rickettsiales bacterium]|jgi:DNA repair protein RecN (Recombination protein N)|nr:DNA repair protein RecN [Rickettsiales bacterium]
MLSNLIINNIVLIDEANINFRDGLCILTGETGSGKSILLDALSLGIGVRSSTRLLRNGEKQGSVIATFSVKNNRKCLELLKEQEIECEDELVLRRVLTNDGKSRAFVNGVPVTQNFLNNLGEQLIEIHGQHDQRGLLNPSLHLDILDEYGNLKAQRSIVCRIYWELTETIDKFNELNRSKDSVDREIDYLQHVIMEIGNLNIQENEEQELDERRKLMMNKEKIMKVLENVKNALEGQNDVEKSISGAQNYLSRNIGYGDNLINEGENAFEEIINDFDKALIEIGEALNKINLIYNELGYDEMTLNDVEERLFSIRGLARKLNITSDLFTSFKKELEEKLFRLQNQNIEMGDLESKISELERQYKYEAEKLSEQRKDMAKMLAEEVLEELKPLKMEKVKFEVEIKEFSRENWGKNGINSVRFLVATNVGTELDDLAKIASGGELSRFMLALKVALSKISSVPTLIFDEIDAGVSGAVADAIGERLKKLGQNLQVFVITHLPQVASKGTNHFRVEKEDDGITTRTIVKQLNAEERRIEIAKMLSNDKVSDEAIRAADVLLNRF